MNTLNKNDYEKLKLSSSTLIIRSYGVYKLRLEPLDKELYLLINKKPFKVNNLLFQISLLNIKPKNFKLIDQPPWLIISKLQTTILIDKDNYIESYTYELKIDKNQNIVYLELSRKPDKLYHDIKSELVNSVYSLNN